ncbi:beta-ketoacyl-ACP synthase [Microbulbifer spongiae]|uniref:Beta-ketoacyl-ACP synthase n=1 Tax=Microbulbifer spongiae TaxID=2944933 RepID=A0ABY9ECR5_9GAMM|nr:beta-ketoacyl-ACP synthase [Microbulbifer sp. MI-G]WKD49942.1 beta-ketoacyl-ACP synthase [Microbulbifer sp. MI-G]
MNGCFLNHMGLACALGETEKDIIKSLFKGDTSFMRPDLDRIPGYHGYFGKIDFHLPEIPRLYEAYDCRNNRLALAVLQQIEGEISNSIARYSANRIGVVMGTSTSGIESGETYLKGHEEKNFNYRYQQQMGGLSSFIGEYLGIHGPQITVSTACSSSANAFASARRLISMDICDAVIVGGVDSLCDMTIRGFHSLGALSAGQTNPFSTNRDGINLGEAGAVFLMSKEPSGVCLSGIAASSDAYHMSAPHPKGRGAEICMRNALVDAGLEPFAIDYLNLHGTGTHHNDSMEATAVWNVFGDNIICSSTKPLTGHTLGAAGALEVAFCWLAIKYGQILPHYFDGNYDPHISHIQLFRYGDNSKCLRYVMSNSFAFGGNNCSVILSKLEI